MSEPSTYSKEKDVKVSEKSVDVGDNRYVAEVYSYNGGEKKVSLSRFFKGREGNYLYAKKFGRLNKDQVVAVAKLLTETSKEV
jgi:hypothetical protein